MHDISEIFYIKCVEYGVNKGGGAVICWRNMGIMNKVLSQDSQENLNVIVWLINKLRKLF